MSLRALDCCPSCGCNLHDDRGGSRVVGVEYAYGSPERYDGISEWRCPDCGYREGRWSGVALAADQLESRFGGTPAAGRVAPTKEETGPEGVGGASPGAQT